MADDMIPAAAFKDEDLVYVDPDTKSVVGPLEWSRSGNPKSKPFPPPAEEKKEGGRRRNRRKHYPWGTYRSMKRVFQVEGKQKKQEGNMLLDDAIARAMKEPFWD
ncbi:MAG: hypothetical protein PHW10_05660 [Candidatus Peribacteraceae bacterium]|nr:hypothetical protein [Candidatus Peribacteraceae bacterium]